MRKTALTIITLLLLLFCFGAQAGEVLYNAIVTRNYANSTTSVYTKMDKDSKKIATYNPGKKLEVTAVYPNWVEVKIGSKTGYVLRHRVDEVVPLDAVNTPPYGVEVYAYYAVISRDMTWWTRRRRARPCSPP